jgi:hypothetical protein
MVKSITKVLGLGLLVTGLMLGAGRIARAEEPMEEMGAPSIQKQRPPKQSPPKPVPSKQSQKQRPAPRPNKQGTTQRPNIQKQVTPKPVNDED